MKAYGGVDVYIHIFLTSALAGGEWSDSGERTPGTHWIGGWVDPRACLDSLEKRKFLTLPGPLDSPARNQLLYRLRYLYLWKLCRGIDYETINELLNSIIVNLYSILKTWLIVGTMISSHNILCSFPKSWYCDSVFPLQPIVTRTHTSLYFIRNVYGVVCEQTRGR
jgi:hypothetical protein